MLGACNTCVRQQSRVTSSGTTVDGLFLFVYLFVFLLLVHFCYFVCFCFVFVFCFFSQEFWGWEDGGGSIDKKDTGVSRGSRTL